LPSLTQPPSHMLEAQYGLWQLASAWTLLEKLSKNTGNAMIRKRNLAVFLFIILI
jgi:hypothetical protein